MTDFQALCGPQAQVRHRLRQAEINDHLFEGRYLPKKWPDGKKHSRNV